MSQFILNDRKFIPEDVKAPYTSLPMSEKKKLGTPKAKMSPGRMAAKERAKRAISKEDEEDDAEAKDKKEGNAGQKKDQSNKKRKVSPPDEAEEETSPTKAAEDGPTAQATAVPKVTLKAEAASSSAAKAAKPQPQEPNALAMHRERRASMEAGPAFLCTMQRTPI